MATINGSPHLQFRHNLSLYLANWKWLHLIVIAFNTLCPVVFYIQWCVALWHQTHWGWYFEKLICSRLEILFSQKATTVGSLRNFSSSYINHEESLSHNIFLHYYLINIKHIFQSVIYITKKLPNLVAKILATKFGFVPAWLICGYMTM